MIRDVYEDLSGRRERVTTIFLAPILVTRHCRLSIHNTIILALCELVSEHGGVKSLILSLLLITSTSNGLNESGVLGRGQGLVVFIVKLLDEGSFGDM